jgi:hypothetical protein
MDTTLWLGWVGLVLGLISRIFIPWLNVRRLNPENAQWSWRYVWPQLVSVVIVGLGLPLVITNTEVIGLMALTPAYLVGWGAADVGRFVDRAIFIRRNE